MVADFDAAEQALLARAGIAMGMGFQLADDLLDITGDEKEVGKKLQQGQSQPKPQRRSVFRPGGGAAPASTSYYREALRLIGELEHRLPALPVPVEKHAFPEPMMALCWKKSFPRPMSRN